MINFFRHIRRSLLTENKISKYLLYALGEIVLVVIGILIALSINNWNGKRQNRAMEKVLLRQLKQEFMANMVQLNDKIEQRNNIISSAKRLLHYFDQGDTSYSDSLVYHLQRTLFIPTFNANAIDYFSGRDISLIQNDSLRALLAEWPGQVDQLIEEEQQWVNYRDSQYVPFITSHFQARNLYNGVQADLDMMRTVFLDKKESFKDRIGNSRAPVDLNALMANSDFEDHLGFTIMVHNLSNIQSYTLSGHLKKILEQINN